MITSHQTKTLDILEYVMQAKQIQYLRLAKYVPGKTEHETLVGKFNDIYGHNLVLLLDSKAASPGLNLTIADRLLFIDQE